VIEAECDRGWVKNYTQLDSTLFSDLNSSKNLRATPRYIPYAVGGSDRLCK